MLKRNFLVPLALFLIIFALLIQCKAKYGTNRLESIVKTEMEVPAFPPAPERPEPLAERPEPRQRPTPRPEREPEQSFEREVYAEKEGPKNSEYISKERRRSPLSEASESKTLPQQVSKEVTAPAVIKEKDAGVKATLGISYFKSIRQHETKDLRVSAIFNGDAKLVRKRIRDIEAIEYEYVPKEDSSTIQVVKDITLFKKLKIKLHYDKADFTVTPVPEDAKEEQELDFESGNDWHWTLRAVADKPHPATIKVEIYGETHKGDLKLIALKEVEIKIDITQSETFWSKVVHWPGDHLDYIIESLIVPLVIYLWRRRKKKRRANLKEDKK